MTLDKVLLAIIFSSLMILPGCMESEDKVSTLSIEVTDAITDDYSNVYVNFTSVEVHGTDSKWVTVVDEESSVDLLTLGREGITELLGDSVLEAGKYTQIRMHVDSAYAIDKQGEIVDVKTPKKIKINRPFTLEEGEDMTIIIDIDLERSLKEKDSGLELQPVIGYVDDGKEKTVDPTVESE